MAAYTSLDQQDRGSRRGSAPGSARKEGRHEEEASPHSPQPSREGSHVEVHPLLAVQTNTLLVAFDTVLKYCNEAMVQFYSTS